MSTSTPRTYLQEYTKLPIKELVKVEGSNSIVVLTPHKGEVIIEAKNIHHPFLFGSTTNTDKTAKEILRQIFSLEEEAKLYLLNKWLTSPK